MWKRRLTSGLVTLAMLLSGVPATAAQGGTGQGEPEAETEQVYSIPELSVDARAIDEEVAGNINHALNAEIKASHMEGGTTFSAENAVDGNIGTRWASGSWGDKNNGDEWLIFDLGERVDFNTIIIKWDTAFASNYTIDTSSNIGDVDDMTSGVVWDTPVHTETDHEGGTQELRLPSVAGRYVRLHMTKTASDFGASIFELQLFNRSDEYYTYAGTREMSRLSIPRYPGKNLSLPGKTSTNTPVVWESTNDAITITGPDDNDVVTAVVTPMDTAKEGYLSATVAYGSASDTALFYTTIKARDDQLTDYRIYPQPQRLNYGPGQNLVVTDAVNVVVKNDMIDEVTRARATEVLENHGMSANFVTQAQADAQTDVSKLVLDVISAENEGYFVGTPLVLPEGGALGEHNVYDAYQMNVTPSAAGIVDISITGKHNDATYYALASLDQILDQRQEKNGIHTLSTTFITDYANSKYRGIVEGFYGYAYSKTDIESLLEYGKRYKMNTFVYDPKVDPYHLESWRDAYPTTLTDAQRKNGMLTQDDIREIAQKSEAYGIDFVWTVHPMMQGGVDITTAAGVDQGVYDVLAKYQMMYDLGVRHFGLSVDGISVDLAVENSDNQAKLIGDVAAQWKAAHPADFNPLFYVPTICSLDAADEAGKQRNFGALADLSNLDDIVVTFTGDGVWSTVNNAQMTQMANYLHDRQKPMFWWNSPINDNMDANLFLGPLDQRYDVDNDVTDAVGMVTNTMNQAESSKVSLFGMLDYAWNIVDFDAMQNWQDSFQTLLDDPALLQAFSLFAANSAPTGDMGDKTGVTYSGVEALVSSLQSTGGKTPENMTALRGAMSDWRDACAYLQQNLKGNAEPKLAKLYEELAPWIAKSYGVADLAVNCLDLALSADNTLQTYYDALYQNTAFAVLPTYQVTSLEGAGLDGYEQQQEVFVGGSALLNFVPTLLGWAKLPVAAQIPAAPADLTPTLLKSDAVVGAPTLSAQLMDGFEITGLAGTILPPGAYIGASFPELANFQRLDELATALPIGLTLQYSTNGRSWRNYDKTGIQPTMSALRIVNKSGSAVTLTGDKLTISVQMLSPARTEAVTNSGRGQYQNNPLTGLADGDWSTSYWSNGSPESGEWFQIEYAAPFQFVNLTLAFDTRDNLDEKAMLAVSTDGVNWTEIGVLNGDILPETQEVQGKNYQIFTLADININGKYLRWTITEYPSRDSNAMRCYNVVPNDGLVTPVITAASGKGMAMLLDGDPSTLYVPTGADSVTYHILAPQKIDAIIAYLKADTLPKAEVLASGMWQQIPFRAGATAYAQVLDTTALSGVAALRLSWTEQSRPAALFDLSYVTGVGEDQTELSDGGDSSSDSSGGSSSGGAQTSYPLTNGSAAVERSNLQALVKEGKSLTISSGNATLVFDTAAVQAMVSGATGKVTFRITKADISMFPDAVAAIGTRPAFTFTVMDAVGKLITDFGKGSVSISIPYTLSSGEIAGNVQAVYVDGSGKVEWLTSSSYDSTAKMLRFSISHFSVYGVGYKEGTVFTDIAGHWAEEDIRFVAARGILNGTGSGQFTPGGNMTRGMFVTALWRLAGSPQGGEGVAFTDVPLTAYYADAVNWAAKSGIVSGTGATTFGPDQAITREQMAVLLANYSRATGYALPEVNAENAFADANSIAAWAKDAVGQMQMAGILNGKSGNTFDPQGTATRAEVAATLRRYVELLDAGEGTKG